MVRGAPITLQRALLFGLIWTAGCSAAPIETADQTAGADHVGAVFEISSVAESTQESSGGSSGSSSDRSTLIERVLRVREDGLELEYDFPATATANERAPTWQLPVRVFRPTSGPPQLLNRPELEGRVDAWLKKGGMTRAACNHWVFTWNAFKIECDPLTALELVAAFDLRLGSLRDGATFRDPRASAPIMLAKSSAASNGARFEGTGTIDPERLRRGKAESDVVIANIGGKPLTLDDALRARSGEKITGTIAVTLETDASGQVWRRTTVSKIRTTTSAGATEDRTSTEVVTRRALPSAV